MRVFGYKKNKKKLLELKEVTFQCTIEELDKIIEFFSEVKSQHSKVIGKTEMCHSHYQDWDDKWTSKNPDVIIATTHMKDEL